MIADDEPLVTPQIGHNSAGSMLEIARDEQRTALDGFTARRDQIVRAARAAVLRDRATAGSAGDIVKIAGEVWDMIDGDRKARTAPYRQVHHELSGMVTEFWAEADDALRDLRDRIDAFMTAFDQQMKDEQDAQQRQMEELLRAGREIAAPTSPAPVAFSRPHGAPPPKRTKARGDLGAIVSRGESRVYLVDDVRALPDWVLESDPVRAAIDAVLRQSGKHMKAIPGVTIATQTNTHIR